MTSTAHTDLTHIAARWPVLRELLEASTPRTWPPAGRMADHQRTIDDALDGIEVVAQQAAAERAERTALAPGEHPAPLRVAALDTILDIEADLLALADSIASSIQRPAFTIRGASPADTVARDIALISLHDAQDPRRWSWTAAGRTGRQAATWLAARLGPATGPFRALTGVQLDQLAADVAAIRRRVDRLLDGRPANGAHATGRQCECGGEFQVTNGQDDFVIGCPSCGSSWTGTALLNGLTGAA
ncbi:hypothetical protein [Kitasatospora sp. NPDC018619]|uniref:hypothetical protein n=1 Tax=unclassified Kitasatospora TaxID=2633591 RepID=UPI0037B5004B